ALPIMLSGAAHARDAAASAPASTAAPAIAFSMPSLRLPGATQPAPRADPVQYAQATDPRVAQLEEQVRQLTGTLEELNFQILQMQDQLRRMQEDNEIRFQELEQKRSDAGGAAPTQDRAAVGSGDGGSGGSGDDDYYAASPRVEDGS